MDHSDNHKQGPGAVRRTWVNLVFGNGMGMSKGSHVHWKQGTEKLLGLPKQKPSHLPWAHDWTHSAYAQCARTVRHTVRTHCASTGAEDVRIPFPEYREVFLERCLSSNSISSFKCCSVKAVAGPQKCSLLLLPLFQPSKAPVVMSPAILVW